MRITDQHIATYHRQGFAMVEDFLTREEVTSALQGFHALFAPDIAGWRAGQQIRQDQALFPWDHSGLNHCATHPEIIAAAERIIGTREIRLSDCDVNVRYAGETYWDSYHLDQPNNTLGPVRPEDHSNISFAIVLTDVQPGMAPTCLVPWGKTDGESVTMTVRAGTLYFYSTHTTRHAASQFTAPEGYRAAMWTMYSRKDRLWDCARPFGYKWGGGQKEVAIKRFIAESTPRRLELLGFPAPGDALWSESFIQGMAERYPGFDVKPYLEALAVAAR